MSMSPSFPSSSSSDEERAGRELRTGLLDVEPPASRLGVEQILRDGRRGERRARVARALGGAALAVVVGVPLAVLAVGDFGEINTVDRGRAAEIPVMPPTPARCAITELSPASPGVTIDVADPTGTILFGVSNNHLVRWRNGVQETVAIDDVGGVLMPTAVNSAGVAVGFYTGRPVSAPTPEAGWVFRDGVLTPLALPAGARSATPHAINAAGDIAGAMMPADGALPSLPVVWPAGSPGSPRLLDSGAPGAPAVSAVPIAIGDDGTVVGDVPGTLGRPGSVAVWAPGGTRRDLVTPAGWTGASARAIRDGVVYGTVRRDVPLTFASPAGPSPSFVPGSGRPMPKIAVSPARWTLDTGKGEAYAIDGPLLAAGGGWILVGPKDPNMPSAADPGDRLTAVGPGGEARTLPTPAAGAAARAGSGLPAGGIWISDDGRAVIGRAVFGAGDSRPVTWTCE